MKVEAETGGMWPQAREHLKSSDIDTGLKGVETMLQVSEDRKATNLCLSTFTLPYLHPGVCSWLPLVGLHQLGGREELEAFISLASYLGGLLGLARFCSGRPLFLLRQAVLH